MACAACSGKAKRAMTLSARATPAVAGGFLLATHPDCTSLHRGDHQGDSVYVVERGNLAKEKLFKRKQLAEASTYAKEVRGTIENLPTTQLCDAAILALYA